MGKQLSIGLFGFGVVGEGVYKVLQELPSVNAQVKKICIRNADKKRNAPEALFTTNYDDILNDPDINLVVELIDDASEAYKIVTASLRNGKAVVSANKKLIAEHLPELIRLQQENEVPFLYEAAVCGSIPIIRNLEEYYDNDLLKNISGIVNGSTNYILTKISEGKTYADALKEAQKLGFAESNPSLDVEGFDPVNKLTILLAHAYGIVKDPAEILRIGITRLQKTDAVYAAEKNYKIKLVAQSRTLHSGKVAAFLLPQFVTKESQLFNVSNEYNGVTLESRLADNQFLYGKGAGRYPTSSAVLSDISALRYDYRYEYRKLHREVTNQLTDDFYLRVFVSFSSWSQINRDDFEWLEELRYSTDRNQLVGVIHFARLKKAPWLNNSDCSLVVCPDGFVEDIELRKLKERSFELAGSQMEVPQTFLEDSVITID